MGNLDLKKFLDLAQRSPTPRKQGEKEDEYFRSLYEQEAKKNIKFFGFWFRAFFLAVIICLFVILVTLTAAIICYLLHLFISPYWKWMSLDEIGKLENTVTKITSAVIGALVVRGREIWLFIQRYFFGDK